MTTTESIILDLLLPALAYREAFPNPEALSKFLDGYRDTLRRAEEATADLLPHLDPDDARELCNNDRTIQREIEAWRDRLYSDTADVSELADTEDPETWEIVAGGSSRFAVRKVACFEVRRVDGLLVVWNHDTGTEQDIEEYAEDDDLRAAWHGVDPDQEHYTDAEVAPLAELLNQSEMESNSGDAMRYIVVDTEGDDTPDPSDYDNTDEDSATEHAASLNRDDYQNTACGWPFAWNHAYVIHRSAVADFAACGFVVAEYKGDTLYAGIDGGGYSFTEAHWAPMFFRHMSNGYGVGYVRTSAGLRRVEKRVAK